MPLEVSRLQLTDFQLKEDTQSLYKAVKDNPVDRIERVPWNKGITGYSTSWKGGHHSKESKEKMSKRKIGIKLTNEHKKKISMALKGKMPKNIHTLDNSGFNSHWWKGGITSENESLRKGREFKKWRKLVFDRDDYTCCKCKEGKKSKKRTELNPHHIFNFSDYPEKRFEVDNGMTLCRDCHYQFHSIYGYNNNNLGQMEEFLCKY